MLNKFEPSCWIIFECIERIKQNGKCMHGLYKSEQNSDQQFIASWLYVFTVLWNRHHHQHHHNITFVFKLCPILPYFRCKHTESQIFFGEICEYSMLKTTTKVPTTPDPFPVSKLSIIAISGGTGGALLLIILISTICFCYRLKHAERKGWVQEIQEHFCIMIWY